MRWIVPIVSGKGGVGKSTVAVNLAVSFAEKGFRTALIDADLYGPSIPTLMGGGSVKPDNEGRLIPPVKFGVKYISLGFFLQNPDDPVIWRGPMFNKALTQLFRDVNWGDVDLCIVDMPPGTGDAAISLAQMVKLAGAVVVTTPQEVSLADVRKALNMLLKVNVPVIGIVENMAGFRSPDGVIHYIFGEGGGRRVAEKFGVPFLCSIPIDQKIREGGDLGRPVSVEDGIGDIFSVLAETIRVRIEELESERSEVQIVN